MTTLYVQSNTQYLAGAGVIVGATNIVVQSFADIYGNALSMADFGLTGFITLEPDTSNEEAALFTSVTPNANGTVTLGGVSTILAKSPYTAASGLVRAHGGGTKVVVTDNVGFWNTFANKANNETITGQWNFLNTPIVPGTVSDASTTVKGVSRLSVAPVVANIPIAVGDNDPRISSALVSFPGMIVPYPGRTAPSAWLMCDGSAVSRSTYASLFSILCPSGTVTITVASPAVLSKASNGYLIGDRIHLTTTGGLPSGLSANTDYYVSNVIDVNTFNVALSPGGPNVTTTGSQSGVHTVYLSAYGKGDGSTTFNVPDFRARSPIAVGQSSYSILIDSSNVTLATPSVFTVPADSEIYQGQSIVLTTTGSLPTGFSPSTTYYVIRASQTATSIQLASSQANANDGIGIAGSGSQSGVHSLASSVASGRTILGRAGGEETHGISTAELSSHAHPYGQGPGTPQGSNRDYIPNSTNAQANLNQGNSAILSSGGDVQHNNMSPFLTVGGWIIKQ